MSLMLEEWNMEDALKYSKEEGLERGRSPCIFCCYYTITAELLQEIISQTNTVKPAENKSGMDNILYFFEKTAPVFIRSQHLHTKKQPYYRLLLCYTHGQSNTPQQADGESNFR